MKKKKIFLVFVIFLELEFGFGVQSKSKVVLDITQVISNQLQNLSHVTHTKAILHEVLDQAGQYGHSHLAHYESNMATYMNDGYFELKTLADALLHRKTANQSQQILISLKYDMGVDIFNTTEKRSPYCADLYSFIANYSAIIFGIAFDMTNVDQKNKSSSDISYMESLPCQDLYEERHAIKFGYVINSENLNPISVHNFDQASILIVDLPLSIKDKEFVESFGIFKENMDTIYTKFLDDNGTLQLNNFTLFYRIGLNSIQDRKSLELNEIFNNRVFQVGNPEIVSYFSKAILRLRDKEKYKAVKYRDLLLTYVNEWVSSNINAFNAIVRIKHSADKNLSFGGDWIETNHDVVPYVTNLPIAGFDEKPQVTLPATASILLEDQKSSGFDGVMINEKKWNQLANKSEHLPSCQFSECRPKNIFLMIDNLEPFFQPVHTERKNLQTLGEMSLTALFFLSNGQVWNKYIQNQSTNSNDTIAYACYFQHVALNNEDAKCDSACFGYKMHKIDNNLCSRDMQSTVNGFVWRFTVRFSKDKIDDFVTSTRERLEGLLIGREMYSIQNPGKQFESFLHVRGEYFDKTLTEGFIRGSLYCTKLGRKINEFYEFIVTWAKIHEFVVIVEPVNLKNDWGNPLVWDRLKVRETTNSKLRQTMESGPIFYRRSYSKSKMFGGWTKGMYPCLKKATNVSITKSMNFDHEYSGVTLNLNLLHGRNAQLHEDEIQMLLLLMFQRFQKVEIILENQFSQLRKTLENTTVIANFMLNKIKKTSVFIQIPDIPFTAELKNDLDVILRFLGINGITVRITQQASLNSALYKWVTDNYPAVRVGIVRSDCLDLGVNKVTKSHFSDNRFSNSYFLICQTDQIFSNNSNVVTMQDFLDTHLYLSKLLKYSSPLKEVHFRLNIKYVEASDMSEKRENLLMFLSDVNRYAKSHQVHYFLLPAFAKQGYTEKEPSFWEISDYRDLTNGSVFEDIEAEITGQATWLPQFTVVNNTKSGSSTTTEETAYSNRPTGKQTSTTPNYKSTTGHLGSPGFSQSMVFLMTAGAIGLFVIVGFLAFKVGRDKIFLTQKELKEFRFGKVEIIQEAIQDREQGRFYSGNFFEGLMYQTKYELTKQEVSICWTNVLKKDKASISYLARLDEIEKDAVVRMTKKGCPKDRFVGMLSDIKLLCYIGDHSNILKFLGCYTKEIHKSVVWVAMDFCEGGTLLEYLNNRKDDCLEENIQDLLRFCQEIACGMKFIADQDVIHGDLAAKHVLLDGNLTCKIKGFGLAEKSVKWGGRERFPWQWIAPEALRKLRFTLKSDVWSYGVTLWEIFSLGETPYPGMTWKSTFIQELEKGFRMPSPSLSTQAIEGLFLQCWELKPDKRPGFGKILEYLTLSTPNPKDVSKLLPFKY